MSQWSAFVVSCLANAVWQLPLLCVAAWVAARCGRAAGVRLQHAIWVTAQFLMTILPVLASLSDSPLALARRALAWLSPRTQPPDGLVKVHLSDGRALSIDALPHSLLLAVACVWAAATLFFAIRFALRCVRVARLVRGSRPAVLDARTSGIWSACLRSADLHKIPLHEAAGVFSPLVVGIRRPMVIVPHDMLQRAGDAELRAAFAHELEHIRRRDFTWNILQELIALPVTWHPALWISRTRIAETREMICDEAAASLDAPGLYARSLLDLARLLLEQQAPIRISHAIGVLDANTLEKRVMRLRSVPRQISPAYRRTLTAMCFAVLLAVTSSGIAMGLRVDDSNSSSAARHTVPGREMEQHAITKVPPVYPVEAKKAHIQGTVVLDAIIGADGRVDKLTVKSGPKELQQSSLDAVRQWTYRPYEVDGHAVEVETEVNITYSLAK